MALDTLRKGAARTLGLILVGLLVVSFAIWGIADIFTGYGQQTLIRVGDTELTSQDYLRAQQEVLRSMSQQAGRSLSIQEARALGLDARVLERLIGGAAVDTHANHLGLGVSDDALLGQIMKDPAFQDPTGNFSPIAFQAALRNIGMSEAGYLYSLREQNLRRQLLTTIGEVADSPQVLIDALNRYNEERRILRYVLVPQSAAGEIGNPTEEQLKSYYDNHHAKFTQPEYRKLGVLAVTPETVKDQVNISEADLKAAYEAQKNQLGNPERRHIQQIAFPDMEAAKAAHEKIKSGTDFVEVAKERGLSDSDIDLGTVARNELADPVIAEEAFKLEANGVSEPITGKLGSVVLVRVIEIEPGKTPTFEEAKADLEEKILKDRASGAIFDLHDRIEDELAAGSTLAETAAKLKLDYVLIDQVDREGRKPDGSTVTLPAQKDVLNGAFATDTGIENDPIDARDEGVIWYEVLGITPEQLKPFDQVRDEVEKDWLADEARNQVAKFTQGLVTALSSGSKSLEDMAKELGTEVLPTEALKRDDITVNVLPAAVAQAFTLPKGGYGSAPSGVEEGRIVFKVEDIVAPPAIDERAIERLKSRIGLLISEDTIAEYFGALENRYGVSVNQQALAKLVGTGEEP
ncbi:MAG: peptidyl-prolyl cis-trans isomerase [Methyloceanibacter sp.]|uniref:peptidyl-prolyl cis-trans isomerase n=1 Tax=Methyloceanibacter sp. TaxID=1965321 RepID=UPI003D6C8D2A